MINLQGAWIFLGYDTNIYLHRHSSLISLCLLAPKTWWGELSQNIHWLCNDFFAIADTTVSVWVWLALWPPRVSNTTSWTLCGCICNVGGGRPSDVQEILNRLPATTGVVVNVDAPGLTEIRAGIYVSMVDIKMRWCCVLLCQFIYQCGNNYCV